MRFFIPIAIGFCAITAMGMPRDGLALDVDELPRDYRLRVKFTDQPGSVSVMPGQSVTLAPEVSHDIAVERDESGEQFAIRHWADGVLQGSPQLSAIPEDGEMPRPSVTPGAGGGISESWVQPLARVDHAELVRGWKRESFTEGRRVYRRDCMVCHGNIRNPGSLPTALRFSEGVFRNGADPHSMFLTQFHGFEQMAPQPLLTTREHYEVIHYIREALIRPHNPGQLVEITDQLLDVLPKGRLLAPPEVSLRPPDPHTLMDFGNAMFWTFGIERDAIAQKGIAIRIDSGEGGISKGRAWMIYDHDTLALRAVTTGSFIDWRGIAFDGSHGTHARLTGDLHFSQPATPGWASPGGGWDDPRAVGRDGRPFGPLPQEWLRYEGIYHHGEHVVIAMRIGKTRVLELPGWVETASAPVFTRTFETGDGPHPVTLRVAPDAANVVLTGDGVLVSAGGYWTATLPPNSRTRLFIASIDPADAVANAGPTPALEPLTRGGPRRWDAELTTTSVTEVAEGPFLTDTFPLPIENPWHSWMRPGGFDFTPDGGGAFVATWNGDVWRVDGIREAAPATLRWRRIASGLFQPLGVKTRGDSVYILCRDQIVRLVDLNGNGEADLIANFNNDHQVSENFHEFAMGLQSDADGNFLYAKAARHARDALFPHHGTLLRVSADGSNTEVVATGFRAPNGVFIDEDGTIFVTDQEGDWTPKNRINRVNPGTFHGNMQAYSDITDASDDLMEKPVVWITNRKDRSPGELIRVPRDVWGRHGGTLLNMSYGVGRVFVVPYEEVEGVLQGAVCELPGAAFSSGIMRGRFGDDGALYVCGLYAWASNVTSPGGFYRIRYNPQAAAHVPLAVRATQNTLTVVFSDPIDPKSVDLENIRFTTWGLRRSRNYGSPHLNETKRAVTAAVLAPDGVTLALTIPDLAPTDGYELIIKLQSPGGAPIERSIHGTIHRIGQP